VNIKELSDDKFVYEVNVEFLPEVDIDVDKKLKLKKQLK